MSRIPGGDDNGGEKPARPGSNGAAQAGGGSPVRWRRYGDGVLAGAGKRPGSRSRTASKQQRPGPAGGPGGQADPGSPGCWKMGPEMAWNNLLIAAGPGKRN